MFKYKARLLYTPTAKICRLLTKISLESFSWSLTCLLLPHINLSKVLAGQKVHKANRKNVTCTSIQQMSKFDYFFVVEGNARNTVRLSKTNFNDLGQCFSTPRPRTHLSPRNDLGESASK